MLNMILTDISPHILHTYVNFSDMKNMIIFFGPYKYIK